MPKDEFRIQVGINLPEGESRVRTEAKTTLYAFALSRDGNHRFVGNRISIWFKTTSPKKDLKKINKLIEEIPFDKLEQKVTKSTPIGKSP